MALLIGTARRHVGAPPLRVSSQREFAHYAMLFGACLGESFTCEHHFVFGILQL
jgi:hypothetical protein